MCMKNLSDSNLALSFDVSSANGCHGKSYPGGQGGWLEPLLCGLTHL